MRKSRIGGLDEVFTRTDSNGPLSFIRDGQGSTVSGPAIETAESIRRPISKVR